MLNKKTRDSLKKIFNESNSINEVLLKLNINGYNYPENKFHLCKYLRSIVSAFGTSSIRSSLDDWERLHIDEILNVNVLKSWHFTKDKLPKYQRNLLDIWKDKRLGEYLKRN